MTFTVSTLSSGDLTILRYPYQKIENLKVNIPALVEVGRADIASTPSSYPRAEYSTNNESAGWTDGKSSMFVRIYDSTETEIRYEGILRKNSVAGTVYLAGHVRGDTGIAREGTDNIVAGNIVIVYDHRIPKSFLSRFDSSTFYKRWDVSYANQTLEPDPIVNMGADQQANVDSGTGKATFTLDASNSDVLTGNSLTYQWFNGTGTPPTGITITSGTATSSSLTVSADPGEYVIECAVTDATTTNTKRGYRYLFANDAAGGSSPAFSDTYHVTAIENMTVTRDGWGATITVETTAGDGIPTDRLYTGAPFLMTYDTYYSADGETWVQTTDTAMQRRTFKGYIRRFNDVRYNANGAIYSVTFTIEDVLTYMGSLPIANQVYIMADPPTNWTQAAPFMMTPAGLAFILTTSSVPSAFQTGDFYKEDLDASNIRKQAFEISAGDVRSGLKAAANFIPGCNIGCHPDGSIYMRRNISLESNTYKSAINNRFTWTDADIVNEIGYERDEIMQAGETTGSAFVYSGGVTTAYKCRMGLNAQMQGVARITMQDFIAEDETDAKQKVGDWHAYYNRPTRSMTWESFIDVVDPALMEPHVLDLASYNPLPNQLGTRRIIPLSVRYTWNMDNTGEPPDVFVEFEPMTNGKPADLVPVIATGTSYDKPDKIRVTFDTNGYPNYTIYAFNNASTTGDPAGFTAATSLVAAEAAVGNGGDAAQGTGNSDNNDQLYVYVDLVSNRTVDTISVDFYASMSGTWESDAISVTGRYLCLDSSYALAKDVTGSDNPWTINRTGAGAGTDGSNGVWGTSTTSGWSSASNVRYIMVRLNINGGTGAETVDLRIDNIIITLG